MFWPNGFNPHDDTCGEDAVNIKVIGEKVQNTHLTGTDDW